MCSSGNGIDVAWAREGCDALRSKLQQRAVSYEWQEKFWTIGAAERPESRSRSTRRDDSIEISVHGVRIEAPVSTVSRLQESYMEKEERCLKPIAVSCLPRDLRVGSTCWVNLRMPSRCW